MTNTIGKEHALHPHRLRIPKVLAMATIGSMANRKSSELDPATATIWCFDDGSMIALDDRTLIAY